MPEHQQQPDKYAVSLSLTSIQDGQENVLSTTGEAIIRGAQLFIRYEELEQGPQGEAQSVRTTLKITDHELKLIRHGAMESEQTFQAGRRLPGFYRSPYMQFNLSTDTRKLDIIRKGRSLHVSWEYGLYVYEELSGQFALSLHIQEEPTC